MRGKARLDAAAGWVFDHTPTSVVVLAELNGTVSEMTVDELIERKADFKRVVRGDDLKEIMRVVDYVSGETTAFND